MNKYPTNRERWKAVCDRIEQNEFFYAVVSTGIVCQTGCPSRRPRESNVRFYESIGDALSAGYRLCKRCCGNDPARKKVAAICRQIESDYESRSLGDIAAQFDLTPRHMQRLFSDRVGVSPKQFQIGVQIQRFISLVKSGMQVTEAVYASGFRSSSKLYKHLRTRSGHSPSELSSSTFGPIFYATQTRQRETTLLAQTVKGLCFAGFYDKAVDAEQALREEYTQCELVRVEPGQLEPIRSAYDAAQQGRFDALKPLPLDIRGTAFQVAVWEAVRNVPVGTSATYQSLARDLLKPNHTRAVANALAKNKIALAIPCHRVVPATGSSTGGYRWGAERKSRFLELESSDGKS